MATRTRQVLDLRQVEHRWRGQGAGRRSRTSLREVALIAAAALLYTLVRGLTDERVPVAFANADAVISFERAVGIFVEPGLQVAVLEREFMVEVVNAVYIAYWPIVAGALGWVLVRHRSHYPLYRNAVLSSGAVSLVIFALYPLAPPRFVTEHGFIDTIAANSPGYRDFNASALVNEYAAMPSLHVGWILLVSIAIINLARSRPARAAAAVLPVAMFAATVLTANHYIIDGIAGALVVLLGLATATALRRRHTAAQPMLSTRRSAAPDDRPAHRQPVEAGRAS
ncbi:MAG TPA: phosphatase PAP2 family protein [Jiangellaceae bacterium]